MARVFGVSLRHFEPPGVNWGDLYNWYLPFCLVSRTSRVVFVVFGIRSNTCVSIGTFCDLSIAGMLASTRLQATISARRVT